MQVEYRNWKEISDRNIKEVLDGTLRAAQANHDEIDWIELYPDEFLAFNALVPGLDYQVRHPLQPWRLTAMYNGIEIGLHITGERFLPQLLVRAKPLRPYTQDNVQLKRLAKQIWHDLNEREHESE